MHGLSQFQQACFIWIDASPRNSLHAAHFTLSEMTQVAFPETKMMLLCLQCFAIVLVTGQAQWSIFHGPDGHTRRAQGDADISTNGTVKWSFAALQLGQYYLAMDPLISSAGNVYLCAVPSSSSGNTSIVLALNGRDGSLLWQANFPGDCVGKAISANGVFYIACGQSVFAVNENDGKQQWEFQAPKFSNAASGGTLGPDGTVYIAFSNILYALSGTNGEPQWNSTCGWIQSTPAFFNGTVYAVGGVGLYAVDAANGVLRWFFQSAAQVDERSSPAIGADGTVYFSSVSGSLYAVDGKTGTLKWVYALGDLSASSAAIALDGTIYVGSDGFKLHAVNAVTGAAKWTFATGSYVVASPAVGADGTVYIASDDNNFYAIEAETGVPKWIFATSTGHSAAISSDGTVFLNTFQCPSNQDNCPNVLQAFAPSTSQRPASQPQGTDPLSPGIIAAIAVPLVVLGAAAAVWWKRRVFLRQAAKPEDAALLSSQATSYA
jgi:outer membrane protein assembly factor BamB